MKTRKNFKKLLATILATASIFSTNLTLPASAISFNNLSQLWSDKYIGFINSFKDDKDCSNYLLNVVSSFKQDEKFKKIKRENEFQVWFNEKFDKELTSNDTKKINALRRLKEYVNQILTLFVNRDENKDLLIKFLETCINKNGSINLKDAFYISKDEYNHIMDSQFSNAINKFKEVDPSFDEENGDTLKFNNVTVQLPSNKEAIIDQINISKYLMRHIIVGNKMETDCKNKQFDIGHTKYSVRGMEEVANLRTNKLIGVTNTNDDSTSPNLTDVFKKAIKFSPNKYIKSQKQFENTKFYQITYYPLNESQCTIKGTFPEEWEWSDIRTAISKVISNENCIYTSIEPTKQGDKNAAYFYDVSENIPLLLIVNPTDKRIITAIPTSTDELKKQITDNIKSMVSGKSKHSTKSMKIKKENLKFFDDKVVEKIKEESKKENSKVKIEETNDFITISAVPQ